MSPDTSAELVRVLVVDDQAPFRDAARQVVDATAGFAWAGAAASGQEGLALALARARAPDIVVMDVRMPGMGGIETARLLNAERPGIVVLLVSGEPLDSPAVDLLRSRAFAFSRKHKFGSALLRMVMTRQEGRTTAGTRP